MASNNVVYERWWCGVGEGDGNYELHNRLSTQSTYQKCMFVPTPEYGYPLPSSDQGECEGTGADTVINFNFAGLIPPLN